MIRSKHCDLILSQLRFNWLSINNILQGYKEDTKEAFRFEEKKKCCASWQLGKQ